MSGLKNEPIIGGKFLNFKDGKIISAVDGEKKEYTSIEGKLTELDIVDEEFKGKEYRKIVLFITDDEGTTWKLGFPLESGYGNAFCSLALSVDYSKPVRISGGIKEMDNDRSYGMLFIRQPLTPDEAAGDSQKWSTVKWYYTKDSEGIPNGEKKKDRTGEYMDYTARNDFFHRLLIETIRPSILGALNGVEKSASAPKTTKKK